MGNNQCEAFEMPLLKRSAAYGQYECVVQNDREYAIVTKSIEKSIIDFDQLKQELQKRKQIKSINLINLCCYELTHQQGIVELKLQYQYIPLTLQEKREIWRAQDKQLTESELSNILIGIEKAIIELHAIGIGHRCINLETILCLHSLYKLTDISMITFLTGYDLARQGDRNQFLSPHLLNYLQYQGTDPHYSLVDDLFSLAMVIIALVLDCEADELYVSAKEEARRVNMKRVEQGLGIVEERFSAWMGNKLRAMIQNGLGEFFHLGKKSSNQKTKGSP